MCVCVFAPAVVPTVPRRRRYPSMPCLLQVVSAEQQQHPQSGRSPAAPLASLAVEYVDVHGWTLEALSDRDAYSLFLAAMLLVVSLDQPDAASSDPPVWESAGSLAVGTSSSPLCVVYCGLAAGCRLPPPPFGLVC